MVSLLNHLRFNLKHFITNSHPPDCAIFGSVFIASAHYQQYSKDHLLLARKINDQSLRQGGDRESIAHKTTQD